jgi:hypothetical protein
MKDVKEGIRLIEAKKQEIDDLQEAIRGIKQSMVVAFCPVRIGDKVTANHYGFNGKDIIVKEIGMFDDHTGIGFVAKGFVVKKDGTTGLQTAEYRVWLKDNLA